MCLFLHSHLHLHIVKSQTIYTHKTSPHMVPMVPTITCHYKKLIPTIYTYVCNDNLKVHHLFPFQFFFHFFSHPIFLYILFTTFFFKMLFSFLSLPSPFFPPNIIIVIFLGCHIVFWLCFASLLHFIFLFLLMFCKFAALYFLVSTYVLQEGTRFQ
jgi:hypothetical protein